MLARRNFSSGYARPYYRTKDSVQWRYSFNGSNQYATIAAWSPLGANESVSYVTDNEDGRIIGSTYPVSEIGRVSGLFHSGTISNLKLTDLSPLQNRYAVTGNGSDLYGEISEIRLSGDFEIEFDWVRKDSAFGTGAVRLLGSGEDTFLAIFDSGHATNNTNVLFFGGGSGPTWTGAIPDQQGRHLHIKIYRSGSTSDLIVDGTPQQLKSTLVNDVLIKNIGQTNNSGHYTSALANLRITDKSGAADKVYFYPMDEDAGDKFVNRDLDTGSAFDGAWQNLGSNRSFLPNNSRDYPMDDGSGSVLRDRLGNGSTDAIVQNHDESSWERR